MTYDMEDFLTSCVDKYVELAGADADLRAYPTPFIREEHSESQAGSRCEGPCVECPFCRYAFPPPHTYHDVAALEASKRKKQSCPGSQLGEPGGHQPQHHADRGRLQPIASRVLIKILWAARLARFDLLRALSHLATFVTKRTSECDRKLHRLVGYIHATKSHRMIGWVGDELRCIKPHLYADADFAGCTSTQRSTSGVHVVLRGPNTSFPAAGLSKRQGCVSHSTAESEIVASNFALRTTGLPGLLIWDIIFPRQPPPLVHEENQTMIRCIKTGRNPAMRYLGKTHRCSVAWLHERFGGKGPILALRNVV